MEAVGEGVTNVTLGDRVSYNGGPLGACATEGDARRAADEPAGQRLV